MLRRVDPVLIALESLISIEIDGLRDRSPAR